MIEGDFEVLIGVGFTKDIFEDSVSTSLDDGVLINPVSNKVDSESHCESLMSWELSEDSANDSGGFERTKESATI